MAKLTITIDTESKALAVTIDGEVIQNAKSVSAYQYCDSNGNPNGIDCSVRVIEKQSDSLVKETAYYAQGSVECGKVENSGHAVYNKQLPKFVGITVEGKAQADIAQFMSTKLGKL
jgi:hypothetical protein